MSSVNSDTRRIGSNPFPRSAVAKDRSKALPNYPTRSQDDVIRRVQDFASAFSSPQRPEGRGIGIRGDIGSGKTHAAFRAMDKIKELIPSAKCVYIKALGAHTLYDFYTQVIARNLEASDFKNLVSQHYAKLLLPQAQPPETPDSEKTVLGIAADEAATRLRDGDQQFLLRLIQSEMIPTAGLKAKRTEEVSTALVLGEDLVQVYLKVPDPTYGPLAMQWLQGQPLTEQQERDIGVHSRITSSVDAEKAMRFLLNAYRLADVPFMIAIDELERTVLTTDGAPNTTGRNLVKDIVEVMSSCGHVTVVGGMRDAWNSLTADWFSRLLQHDVCDMTLTIDEARELLHVWEHNQPSAFSAAAIGTAAEVAEKNVRRLLEVAHHSWEIWAASTEHDILPSQVREATSRVMADSQRRQDALQLVTAIAATQGLPAAANPSFPDYDLVLGAAAAPAAFVKVTASVFKDDEVDDVRKLLEARQHLLRRNPSATTMSIIAGYSSPAVIDHLRAAGDQVVRFDDVNFGRICETIIGNARRSAEAPSPAPAPVAAPAVDDKAYTEILRRFETVAKENSTQVAELRDSLQSLQRQRTLEVDRSFAQASTPKLSDVLEQLMTLLAEEQVVRAQGDKERLQDNIRQQSARVEYARFLDRVVPDSDIARFLDEYSSRLRYAMEDWDDYGRRIDLLREMRRAVEARRNWVFRAKAAMTRRNVIGGIGAISLALYAVFLAMSSVSNMRIMAAYRQSLVKLRVFVAQYDGSARTAIDLKDFSTLSSTFLTARADVLAIGFGEDPPRPRTIENALSDIRREILCATPDCGQLAYDPFRFAASWVANETAVTNRASYATFAAQYVRETYPWLSISTMLVALYAAWRYVVPWQLRGPGA